MIAEKPFALFYGDDYYPSGGFYDFAGLFADVESAKVEIQRKLDEDGDPDNEDHWFHIIDMRTMKAVLHRVSYHPQEEMLATLNRDIEGALNPNINNEGE